MANLMKEIKAQIKTIHWPTKKELYKDTATVVIVSTVLSILISAFSSGIDIIVNKIVELF